MNIDAKSRKADNALRQLRGEEWTRGNRSVVVAIDDFLNGASNETKARLYDIVMGEDG